MEKPQEIQLAAARTPERVGQALAYYAVKLACGKPGKDILKLLNAEWGLHWAKSRRRHVRASLEVLAFCAWLCQREAQAVKLLEAFYSCLVASVPPEYRLLVAEAPPVQLEGLAWGFREFLICRCYEYEEARKLGPDSILEWARILTRDIPDLKVKPMAPMALSITMSAMFTAHLPHIAEVAWRAEHGVESNEKRP